MKTKLCGRLLAALLITVAFFLFTGCGQKAPLRIDTIDAGEVASVVMVHLQAGRGKEITAAEDIRAVCEWFNTADMNLYKKKSKDDVPRAETDFGFGFKFQYLSGESVSLQCAAGSYIYVSKNTYEIQSDEYEDFWALDYKIQRWDWDETYFEPTGDQISDDTYGGILSNEYIKRVTSGAGMQEWSWDEAAKRPLEVTDDRRIAPLDAENVESITLVDGNLGKSKEVTGAEDIQAVCDLLNTTEMEFDKVWTEMGFGPSVTREALFFYFHLSSGETARLVYYKGSTIQDGYSGGDVYRIDTREFEDFWVLDYAEQDWDWSTEYAWIRESAQIKES